MKIMIVMLVSVSLLLFACSKNKFETNPKIEIKSYSSKVIGVNGHLTILLTYFDKEGDLGKGSFWAARYRTNLFPLPPALNKADTLNYPLPDFPKKDKGEISLELNYDFLKESLTENDTLHFRIAISDVKGNKSDTISTDQIVILK